MKRWGILSLSLGVVLAGVCCGCDAKFTRQRYETLHVGMVASEVREILGPPDVRRGETWQYVHHKPYYRAEIEFENGRLKDMFWTTDRKALVRRAAAGPRAR